MGDTVFAGIIGFLIFASVINGTTGQHISVASTTARSITPKTIAVVNHKAPQLDYLSNYSGSIGNAVTVYGSHFSPTNTVYFGSQKTTGYSSNGTELKFTVPNIDVSRCPTDERDCYIGGRYLVSQYGQYGIAVANEYGRSNTLNFNLQSENEGYGTSALNTPVRISHLNGPSLVQRGFENTWTLTLNEPFVSLEIVAVDWGDGLQTSKRIPIEGEVTTIFSHSYSSLGNYTITFSVTDDTSGRTYRQSLSVNVANSIPVPDRGGRDTALSLNQMTSSSGKPGSLLALEGTGFTKTGNTVHFGPMEIKNLDSLNIGTSIVLNVPHLSPGSYQVYVSNYLGQVSYPQYFSVK